MLVASALLALALWIKVQWIDRGLRLGDFPRHRVGRRANLGALLLLAAPMSLLEPEPQWRSMLALNIGLTALCLGDRLHFRYYGDVPSVSGLRDAAQLTRVLPTVLRLVRPSDLLFFSDCLLATIWLLYHGAWLARPLPGSWHAAWLAAGGVGLLLAAARLIARDPDEVFEYVFQRREVVSAIGLLPYHVYDVFMFVHHAISTKIAVSDADRAKAARAVRELLPVRTVQGPLHGRAQGRNLILISAESLQAFVLDLMIDGRPVAPCLSEFARSSLHFTRFFDQTHLGTTADAEFVALHSLYPLPQGAVASRYAWNEFRALPSILADHGYVTMSACAEPPDFWNMRQMHAKLGFQQSHFLPDYLPGPWVGVGLADGNFFSESVPKLLAVGQPFFAYLITSSVHHPYRLPESYQSLDVGPFRGTLLGDYLASIHYFDRAFGDFIEDLRTTGLLDESIVAVFGDHRAALHGEPMLADIVESPGSSADDAHREASDVVTRWLACRSLPFMLRFPNETITGARDVVGGHVDVAPTLLSLAGLHDDCGGVMLGHDLTNRQEGYSVFRDGSVISGTTLFLREANACFDIESGTPVAGSPDESRELARRELGVSDAIIRGNMVPALLLRSSVSATPPVPQRPLVVAHRGNSARAPENTLSAIRSAFEAGADVVEVDVRLSKDRIPVLIHDDVLDSTTDGAGPAAEKTVAELKRLDAGGWMDARFAGERIPTLEEALEAARGRGRLLIDLKADGMGPPIAALLDRLQIRREDVLVGAWTSAQIREFARAMPEADLLRSNGAPGQWDDEFFEAMKAQGVNGFEVGDVWPPGFVRAARRAGMLIVAYTVNDPGTMRRLQRLGVDAIETDDPELAVSVLRNEAGGEFTAAGAGSQHAHRTIRIVRASATEDLIGWHLDSPIPGESVFANRLVTAGWVLGRTSRAERIEVSTGGRVLRRLPVRVRRPDVAAAVAGAEHLTVCGFSGEMHVLARSELVLHAVLEDGSRRLLATVMVRDGSAPDIE